MTPALNFRIEYVPLVRSGKKKMTIRRVRKKGNPKVGDKLTLYTGMRSPQCALIKTVECSAVVPITLFWDGMVILNGKKLSPRETQVIAISDGFESSEDFINFFKETYGLYQDCQDGFEGNIIEWTK